MAIDLLLATSRKEGLHALRKLPAARLRLLQIRLKLHRLLVARVERVDDRALGGAQGLAGLRRNLAGELAHLRLQLVGSHDAVDHSKPVRIRSLQRLAGEEHLVRDAGSSEPGQEPAYSAIGRQA